MNDKLKQQLMVALVVFNFSVLGYIFFKYFTLRLNEWNMGTLMLHIAIGAAIGLVAGAIGYFVAGMGK